MEKDRSGRNTGESSNRLFQSGQDDKAAIKAAIVTSPNNGGGSLIYDHDHHESLFGAMPSDGDGDDGLDERITTRPVASPDPAGGKTPFPDIPHFSIALVSKAE